MTYHRLGFTQTELSTVCALALTTLAIACGGPAPDPEGTGGAAGGSGGVSGTGATGSGGAADQSGGAGSGGAGSGGDDGNVIGTVQVVRTLAYADIGGRATVRFNYVEQAAWDARDRAERTCTREEFGACRIWTCEPATDPNLGDPPSSVRLEAGTITIVPDRDEFTASGGPTGDNNEYNLSSSGAMLGEEILTVTATGGAISAFQGMVQIPLAPLLLSHDASAPSQGTKVKIPVPRTVDLALGWDARGTAQTMNMQTLSAQTTEPGGKSVVSLSCAFEAPSGSGTIPAAALSQLPVGTEIHLLASNRQLVSTPEGDVQLLAGFEAVSSDRTGYPMFVLE